MDKNSFLIELSENNRTDHGRVDFSAQPLEQQVFSAIWALESQVNNGGFASFLKYEDPSLVTFAPKALQTIGAAACADIVDRAVALASSGEIDQLTDQLDSLDSEFYAYPDNLTDLLYMFVFTNHVAFGPKYCSTDP